MHIRQYESSNIFDVRSNIFYVRCLKTSPEHGREEQTATRARDPSDLPASGHPLLQGAGAEAGVAAQPLTMTGQNKYFYRIYRTLDEMEENKKVCALNSGHFFTFMHLKKNSVPGTVAWTRSCWEAARPGAREVAPAAARARSEASRAAAAVLGTASAATSGRRASAAAAGLTGSSPGAGPARRRPTAWRAPGQLQFSK